MSAGATPGRAVRRSLCARHNREWGQTLDLGVPGQRESMWFPPNCPECEAEIKARLEADAEISRLEAELVEETNQRAESDPGRDERIDAAVEADLREQAVQFVAEFYATRRAAFEEFHASQDWQRLYEEVREERRAKLLQKGR
jgi:hypothetical protein